MVQFYEKSESIVSDVAEFIAMGLVARQPAVVIARESHREGILASLRARCFDTDALVSSGLLTMLDPHETLADFMIVNSPSPQRFTAAVGGLMTRVSREHGNAPVRAYGEMVDVLWSSGNTVGALRLEELWNALAESHDFTLFCGYAMRHFFEAGGADALREICERHSHARYETIAEFIDDQHRSRVHQVQQQVESLDARLRNRAMRERELQAALRRLAVERAPSPGPASS